MRRGYKVCETILDTWSERLREGKVERNACSDCGSAIPKGSLWDSSLAFPKGITPGPDCWCHASYRVRSLAPTRTRFGLTAPPSASFFSDAESRLPNFHTVSRR